MREIILGAALAGLIHDLCKLLQRAQDEGWKVPEGTEREGQPVHAAYTESFINSIPENFRKAARAGKYHHRPGSLATIDDGITHLAWVVAVADKLSAGEREKSDEEPVKPPKQLLSIFDHICAGEGLPQKPNYLPLKSLELNKETLFAGPSLPEVTKVVDLCDYLQRELGVTAKGEQQRSKDLDYPETYLENLLSAMQRTTWCVPSSFYYDIPDVSLYDHSRMTAALATCLVDYPQEMIQDLHEAVFQSFGDKERLNFVDKERLNREQRQLLNQPVALLIGGDISGIQDFIYTLSSSGAAKTLRGRSLYLQLLTEAVLRFVLRELDLPYTNVIYAGGGHFYLLAPVESKAKLPQIQRAISKILLKHHGTALYLALGWAKVPAQGFQRGDFTNYWGDVWAALQKAKQRRYQELGEELYPLIFEPMSHGGNEETVCSVCGEEDDRIKFLEGEEEDNTRICELCNSFKDILGKYLPQTGFIRLILGTPHEREKGTAFDCLAEFGVGVDFLTIRGESLFEREFIQPLAQPERAIDWALDDLPKDKGYLNHDELPTTHWKHYMVNYVPKMDFNEIIEDYSHGIPRLGVLRMDVDNLGTIFESGFQKDKQKKDQNNATIARLSTLSFQMSLFFEGWLKEIIQSEGDAAKKYYPKKDTKAMNPIYAVYSGGDDLFLIAPWQIVPELAMRISSDFRSYTGNNSHLHISGGMAFIHSKYPVYQAAEDAKKALDQAKDMDGKDAFCFLDQAWKWEDFNKVHKAYEQLVRLVDELNGPNSILQVLQRLARMTETRTTKGGIVKLLWGPYQWMGAYQLARMIEQYEHNTKVREELERIRKDLGEYFNTIKGWGIAARWAQLFVRNEK